MKVLWIASLALIASACTIQPQGSGVDAQLHVPFTYHQWQVEHYTLGNGTAACAVSSGYNGLTVFMSRQSWGPDIALKSNRRMEPGATLTVSAGSESFQSYDTYFPRDMAKKAVDAMAKGGKAYLEWAEFSGPAGRSFVRVQNIVKLDDFAASLKECRDSLKL